MRHSLVAAGSNALRQAAMRPRGDGAPDSARTNPHVRLLIPHETYVSPGIESISRGKVRRERPRSACGTLVAREIDELRAALGNVLDHALG
jgi:hypothetical protein